MADPQASTQAAVAPEDELDVTPSPIFLATIPQDERWVTEVFGKYFRTRGPGLNFFLPFFERVRAVQYTREFLKTIQIENVLTKDGVTIPKIECELRTRLKTPQEAQEAHERQDDKKTEHPDASYLATYCLPGGPNGHRRAIQALVDSTIREVVGKKDLMEARANQRALVDEAKAEVLDDLDRWGEHYIDLHISDFELPAHIKTLLSAPLEAEKRGEAAVATAEAEAQVITTTATARATATETQAKADKQAVIERAEGEARARVIEAESKAEVLKQILERCNNDIDKAMAYMFTEEGMAVVRSWGEGKGTIILPAGTEGMAALFATLKATLSGLNVPSVTGPVPPSTSTH